MQKVIGLKGDAGSEKESERVTKKESGSGERTE